MPCFDETFHDVNVEKVSGLDAMRYTICLVLLLSIRTLATELTPRGQIMQRNDSECPGAPLRHPIPSIVLLDEKLSFHCGLFWLLSIRENTDVHRARIPPELVKRFCIEQTIIPIEDVGSTLVSVLEKMDLVVSNIQMIDTMDPGIVTWKVNWDNVDCSRKHGARCEVVLI